jgi:tRNA nucleotidyltransferase (CCA-adding enzyme)
VIWPELPGVDVYLVGGAVRDGLLGRPVKEYDWVVVGATPELLLEHGYRQVGRDFPVFLHPESSDEVALARTERKAGSGHTGFTVHADPDVTLEDDLSRRDFTVNALARSRDGDLVDPFGGRADLDARWLRHVTPAFAEDPLRVLRGARFVAELAPWGFRVHPDTIAFMRAMAASGELADLSPERVWRECARALAAPGPLRAVAVLEDAHALDAVFPGLPGPGGLPTDAPGWRVLPEGGSGAAPGADGPAGDDADDGTGESHAGEARWLAWAADLTLAGGIAPQVVRAALSRQRPPAELEARIALAAELAPAIATGPSLAAEEALPVLARLDPYRRRERCEAVLRAVAATPAVGARGAALRGFWHDAVEAVTGPSGRDFAGPGVSGAEVGARLAAARQRALAAVLEAHGAGPGGTADTEGADP